MGNMNIGGDFGQKFIQGVQDVGKQISKEVKELKTELHLPTKAEVKEKLSQENIKQGAQKLSEGVVKMAKKTAGAVLVGLSMITPKKGSESLAPKGMKLLTGKEVEKDYGSYKREKIGLQAKAIYGKALQHIGKGIETAAKKIAFHEKVPAQSKLFDAATSLGRVGTHIKIEGKIAETQLEGFKAKRSSDNTKKDILTKEELNAANENFAKVKENKMVATQGLDMTVMQYIQGGNTQAFGSNSILRQHEDGAKILQALHVAVVFQNDKGESVTAAQKEVLGNVVELATELEDITNNLTTIGLKSFYNDNKDSAETGRLSRRSTESWDYRIVDDYKPDQLSPEQRTALEQAKDRLGEMHKQSIKNEKNLDKSSTSMASGIAVTDNIMRVLKEVDVFLGNRPLEDNK